MRKEQLQDETKELLKELEVQYFAVMGKVLSGVAQRVAWAKAGIETGKWKNVSHACRELEISRGSYYNYKDKVTLLLLEDDEEE